MSGERDILKIAAELLDGGHSTRYVSFDFGDGTECEIELAILTIKPKGEEKVCFNYAKGIYARDPQASLH
jgi:hypothetical protein